MTVPLTIAVLTLTALVAGSAYVIVRLIRQIESMSRNTTEQAQTTTDAMIRLANSLSNSAPKQAEKVAEALSTATERVVNSLTNSFQVLNAPVMQANQAAQERQGNPYDMPVPEYATVGSYDFRDPTDEYVNEGMTDPVAQEPAWDDGNAFGIPGLKLDPAVPPVDAATPNPAGGA